LQNIQTDDKRHAEIRYWQKPMDHEDRYLFYHILEKVNTEISFLNEPISKLL